VHIEGILLQNTIAPQLLGWIIDHLKELTAPPYHLASARVVLSQREDRQGHHDEVCIEAIVADKTFQVRRTGKTLSKAINAALKSIRHELQTTTALQCVGTGHGE
jgi:hypothetical protein